MTKYEYLATLEKNLASLSEEEKNKAMEYYESYFDDAGKDKVDEVIEELGSPEDLAKSICKEIPGVPAALFPVGKKSQTYQKEEVKSLSISLGAALIEVIEGEQFIVESFNLGSNKVNVTLLQNGTLQIDNKQNRWGIFTGFSKRSIGTPKIRVTVPANLTLDYLDIDIGAGSFEARKVNITSSNSRIKVGAGQLILKCFNSDRTEINCGMGSMELEGKLTGFTNAECGMGSIITVIHGNENDYAYKAHVGLGEVKIGHNTLSGMSEHISSDNGKNSLNVNCGMGAVKFKFVNE